MSSSLLSKYRRWRAEAASRTQIARMDDRVLADIGVGRGDVRHMVRKLR